ncbi:MAG: hypothetical protein ABSF18_06870 [Gammaproteobacteria bacterium]|jgi:hypothetical protein
MNELRTLPKDYVKFALLAVVLSLLLATSVGFLLAGGVGAYFYMHDYPISKVITYGVIAWVVYILILALCLYRKKTCIQQKQNYLIHTVKTEIFATMALRSLNMSLRKWKRKHEGS